jgi:uncharacterized protein YciI
MPTRYLIMLAVALLASRAHAQEQASPPAGARAPAAAMAIPKDLKGYYLGILVRGPEHPSFRHLPPDMTIVRAHLSYMRKQVERRKYVTFGPVTEGGERLGIVILEAASLDDARSLLEGDPMVKARQATVEITRVMLPSLAGVQVRY